MTAHFPSLYRSPRVRLAALVLILLLAAAGRLIHIDSESLWVDEGFSYWTIRADDLFDVVKRDVHPPAYFVMLNAWAQVAGISELALRYLSVLPSLLSVAVVYQVAREMARRTGDVASAVPILAALMLALADMELYIAQETRPYAWHVLWALLSMWAFLRWARTDDRRWGIAWVVASILLLYTHYVGGAVLAVEGLVALLFLQGWVRWQAIAGLALAGAAAAPWLLGVAAGQTENVGAGFNVPSTLESLWNWRINWFTQQWALMIGLALAGLAGLALWSRDRKGGRGLAFALALWFVLPVAAAYVLNAYTPILMDYRLTVITPAVALMVAFGLGQFRGATLAFLAAVIVVYGVAIDDTPRPRPPWRDIGRRAAQYAAPGDLALAQVEPSGDWQVIYYFDRFMPSGVTIRSVRQWKIEDAATYPGGLVDVLRAHPHVWFMHWATDRDVFDFLTETGHVQTAVFTHDWLGNDLNVYRYDVIPPEDAALGTFEPGLMLRDAAIYSDDLRVDLWWSAPQTPDADYTISARLLDADGRLVAQLDSAAFNGQRPATTWAPGEVIYDPRGLQLAEGFDTLPPGDYIVSVRVYLWTPEGVIDQYTLAGEDAITVGALTR
jgi:4-amino-4-deoxy-L-arabinose transferase-like glycosyltransferase